MTEIKKRFPSDAKSEKLFDDLRISLKFPRFPLYQFFIRGNAVYLNWKKNMFRINVVIFFNKMLVCKNAKISSLDGDGVVFFIKYVLWFLINNLVNNYMLKILSLKFYKIWTIPNKISFFTWGKFCYQLQIDKHTELNFLLLLTNILSFVLVLLKGISKLGNFGIIKTQIFFLK